MKILTLILICSSMWSASFAQALDDHTQIVIVDDDTGLSFVKHEIPFLTAYTAPAEVLETFRYDRKIIAESYNNRYAPEATPEKQRKKQRQSSFRSHKIIGNQSSLRC